MSVARIWIEATSDRRRAAWCASVRLALCLVLVFRLACGAIGRAAEVVPQFHVTEISFVGPHCGPRDAPARDIELVVTWQHESGASVRVYGFWDGDGRGGSSGDVFKVRFCPSRAGLWRIVKTESNNARLRGQHEGETVRCESSSHPGFWMADGRWYRRSDGSHPMIVGNTHYSFLSGQTVHGPRRGTPVDDVRANARYYKKLRFSLTGDRYPDPQVKPFFDDRGQPSDDGRYSMRPSPQWFFQRVDPVIRAGHDADLICDLILCGPDTVESRSTLAGDPRPWLRYVAARYGSFPNVWFCLCNEWDIKRPRYSAQQIREAGETLRRYLPAPSPISVHGKPHDWDTALNGAWHDHVIIQSKQRRLDRAADVAARNFARGGGKPVCNDENAYEGAGDQFTTLDTIEGCLGTVLGGGYPTTGYKPANKQGHYFWGQFDPEEHRATRSLAYLREFMDRDVRFWLLEPVPLSRSPFRGVPDSCRVLGGESEWLLGSREAAKDVTVVLDEGEWLIEQVDVVARRKWIVRDRARGVERFDLPATRAGLTHLRRVDPQPGDRP